MQKLYSETSISNIADAIRAKGGTGTFTVGEMARAISDLPSGGGASIELVKTVTLTEPVHTFDVSISEYFNEYNLLLGYVNLTPTESDYLYFGWNVGAETFIGSSWDPKSANTRTGWYFFYINPDDSKKMVGGYHTWAETTDAIKKFRAYCYTGSVKITVGSSITIYGVKYANL